MYKKEIKYIVTETGCHECISHAKVNGYPITHVNCEHWRMSRYFYQINFGKIPKGKMVRHTCDNRGCINPKHLIIGTAKDNANDREVRNRGKRTHGEDSVKAVLTNKQVLKIFKSSLSSSKLSLIYNVSGSQIRRIKSGKRWTHLTSKIKSNGH